MQYDFGKNKKEHPDPIKAEVKGKSKETHDNVCLLKVYNIHYFALSVFFFKASKAGMHVE